MCLELIDDSVSVEEMGLSADLSTIPGPLHDLIQLPIERGTGGIGGIVGNGRQRSGAWNLIKEIRPEMDEQSVVRLFKDRLGELSAAAGSQVRFRCACSLVI